MKSFIMLWALCFAISALAHAQQPCLHGPDETPEEVTRRRDVVAATRLINTMQANQPGAASKRYLSQAELSALPNIEKFRQSREAFKDLSFVPGEQLFPGWELRLDVSETGYWFMVKDKSDPCGFAYISNQDGLVYKAEPIR
jgi:hypothetical protein